MLQLVLQLVLLVALASAAPKGREDHPGQLQILSISQQELRALYYTSTGQGIELLSEVSDRFHHLSINTLDGTQLVSARSSSDTGAAVWKIMDSTILLHSSGGKEEERAGIMEYAVPSAFTARLEKEMKRNNYISKKLLNTLDTASTAEVKRSAFSKLLSRPEMDAINEMSHALGAAGVYGHDNQPALNFHGLAMNYAKMQKHSGANHRQPVVVSQPRPKREADGTLTCTRGGGQTVEKNCAHCPIGEYCSGMCGPECACWSFVCGDCCYHQGCFEHDQCCTGGWTYLNYECAFPLPFNCNSYKYKCHPTTTGK